PDRCGRRGPVPHARRDGRASCGRAPALARRHPVGGHQARIARSMPMRQDAEGQEPDGPSLIEDLAQYTSGVRYGEMAGADIAAIRRLVLDTVGCALGAIAADCQPARELADWLRMP